MSVTIKDIAELAKVNKCVVSHILRDDDYAAKLRPETRERVLRISRELGYRRNQLASSTRSGVVNTIAVIGAFSFPKIPFSVAQILAGILTESANHHLNTKVFMDDDLERAFAEVLGNRIQRVISVSVEKDIRRKTAQLCRENGIELVFIYEKAVDEFPAVNSNNFSGAYEAVKYLTGQGHRRIGLLCVPHNRYYYIDDRHNGYLAALAEAGLEADPELMICSNDTDWAAAKLLNLPAKRRPTAVFAIADMLAAGIQRYAVKLGYKLPDDLSVVGFGDSEFAQWAVSPLTTVNESLYDFGMIAVKILLKKECGVRMTADGLYLTEPQLIIRESACSPKDHIKVKSS